MYTKEKKSVFKHGIILLLILVAFAAVLCSCSGSDTQNSGAKAEKKQTTLMIYMVGSDLEAKGGKATADMEEIEKSGIDLSKNHVVIFTGGSPKWHNDNVTKEVHHLLELTKDGFAQAETQPASSMGEAETLSDFLNYAYESYPAEKYALVMWDHGNGPVIGYGKDMLYDDDSLTLSEMKTALDASPFAEGGLEWVGFDACLMASAELASVWSDYACYMVASQEIEPSFGWDYSVFKDLSVTDTPDFLSGLSEQYLKTCEEYYEKRDFSNSDTTLACFDLSKTAELEDAMAKLFSAAGKDVSQNYNTLTVRRVETRALGRATTGSEYDLIDLKDMADNLSEIYSDECDALVAAIDSMIITNSTNAEKCCGMSLYYPFFNKGYYEKEWKEAYSELGVFPEYLGYLSSYADIWLENDFLENYAKSDKPSSVGEQTFCLQLTDEQAQTVAKARYYVLEKMGNELYAPVYFGSNVKKEGNLLTANFDGEILYAKDKNGKRYLSTVVERDTVGDITRYSVPAVADSRMSENEEYSATVFMYDLAVNNKTKEISVSGMVPVNNDGTISGKTEDLDLSPYTLFKFYYVSPSYIRRCDNGVIRPVNDWKDQGAIIYHELPIADFTGFYFEGVDSKEYCFMFELEDTQGNKYCSEPLSVINPNGVSEERTPEQVVLDWKEGESFDLGEYGGVKVSVCTKEYYGEPRYALTLENTNDFTVEANCYIPYINGNICVWANSGIFLTDLAPGESVTSEYGISYGVIEEMGLLESLDSMLISLEVINEKTESVLVDSQLIHLTLPKGKIKLEKTFNGYETMRANLHAAEQEIYNKDGIVITLMGMGKGEYSNLRGILKIENTSDFSKFFSAEELSFDGIGVPVMFSDEELTPGSTVFSEFWVPSEDIDIYNIFSAKDVTLVIQLSDQKGLVTNLGSEFLKCPVELSSEGAPASLREGKTVIFEAKGVRVAVLRSKADPVSDGNNWYVTVVNEGKEDYCLSISDIKENNNPVDSGVFFDFDNTYIAVGEKKIMKINGPDAEDLSCRMLLLDSSGGEILYEDDKIIDLITDGELLS